LSNDSQGVKRLCHEPVSRQKYSAVADRRHNAKKLEACLTDMNDEFNRLPRGKFREESRGNRRVAKSERLIRKTFAGSAFRRSRLRLSALTHGEVETRRRLQRKAFRRRAARDANGGTQLSPLHSLLAPCAIEAAAIVKPPRVVACAGRGGSGRASFT